MRTTHPATWRRVGAVAVTILAALSAAACSNHRSMPGMDHTSATTAAGSAGVGTFNDTDVAFAQQMIPHHQQAVAMADLAAGRASDPQIRSLAGQIKAAQGPEIATMTGWLTAWSKPTTAPSMAMDHSGMPGTGSSPMPGMMSEADMKTLTGLTGAAFDKQFCTIMITHHQGAITMANDELARGSNPDAKKLAQQVITAQQAEIDTMKTIVARL